MATASSAASNKHDLSIVVSKSGYARARGRLHWAIFINRSDLQRGHLFHVLLVDKNRLYYHFDRHDDVTIQDLDCDGYFKVASFDSSLYSKVSTIIEKERAPSNGADGCQEWVFNCLLEMENEGAIPPETCEWVYSLLTLPVGELTEKLGTERWIGK